MLKRIVLSVLLSIVVPLLFSGCAHEAAKPNVVPSGAHEKFYIDPYPLAGVEETLDVRSGNYVALKVRLPSELGLAGEVQRYRVRWYGMSLLPNGDIQPVQFVLNGCHPDGGLQLDLLVEGSHFVPPGTKTLLYTTIVERVYALDGRPAIAGFDRNRYLHDIGYLRAFIDAHGTLNETLPVDEGFPDVLRRYRHIGGGTLLVPLSTPMSVVDHLKGWNPKETGAQKLSARGLSLYLDPTATAAGIVVNSVLAAFTSCAGWHEGCAVNSDYYLDQSRACTVDRVQRSRR